MDGAPGLGGRWVIRAAMFSLILVGAQFLVQSSLVHMAPED
jgi:hypothetical protein